LRPPPCRGFQCHQLGVHDRPTCPPPRATTLPSSQAHDSGPRRDGGPSSARRYLRMTPGEAGTQPFRRRTPIPGEFRLRTLPPTVPGGLDRDDTGVAPGVPCPNDDPGSGTQIKNCWRIAGGNELGHRQAPAIDGLSRKTTPALVAACHPVVTNQFRTEEDPPASRVLLRTVLPPVSHDCRMWVRRPPACDVSASNWI